MKFAAAVIFIAAVVIILSAGVAQAEDNNVAGRGLFGANPEAPFAKDFDCTSSLIVPPLFTFQDAKRFKETGFLGTPWTGWIIDYLETAEGKSRFSILPLLSYYRNEQDNDYSLDMMLWMWSISRSGEAESANFFPLFYHSADTKEGHTVVFPIFWNYWDEKSNGFMLYPFYGQLRSKEFEWTSVLFPVFMESESKWGTSVNVLWPLFNAYSGPGRSGFRLAPLIFSGHEDPSDPYPQFAEREMAAENDFLNSGNLKNPFGNRPPLPRYAYKNQGKDYLVIFPLFWNIDFGATHYFHVWPFFGQDSDVGGWRQYSVLFPFFRYSYAEDWNQSTVWAPWPFFKIASKDAIYSLDNSGEFKPFGRETNVSLMFLFEHTSNPITATTRVYPVFNVWPNLDFFRSVRHLAPDNSAEYSDMQVLPGMYRNLSVRAGEKTFFLLELGPLFLYKSGNSFDLNQNMFGDKREEGWDVLLGLVSYHKLDKKERYGILWGFAGYESDGQTSSNRILWFRF